MAVFQIDLHHIKTSEKWSMYLILDSEQCGAQVFLFVTSTLLVGVLCRPSLTVIFIHKWVLP